MKIVLNCKILTIIAGKENDIIYGLLAGSSVAMASYSGLEKQENQPPVKDDPVSKQPPPIPPIQEKAGRSVVKYLALLH